MEEILGYLVDNAFEAIQGPGVIRLATRRGASGVSVAVSNTGAPIPPEIRERMFEPFFTTKERGTGLGLAIARRVVESHGGRISVASGETTTFLIELPLSDGAATS
jgi:signal transduction histidine kinase